MLKATGTPHYQKLWLSVVPVSGPHVAVVYFLFLVQL